MADRRRSPGSRVKRRVLAGFAVSLGLATLGCGEGFDPPNEVKSLRVLGVHKNLSYAEPGSEVTMNLIWHDGSSKAPRDVVIAWLPPCINPVGNLYYGCFEQFATADLSGGSLSEEFSFRIPDDIVSSLPPPDPGNPAFGTAFAFFIACAGTPVPLVPPPSKNALPLGCQDADGVLLGADDFVAGFATVYVFADGFGNQKPAITGFRVEGVDVPVDCLGVDCAREGSPPEPEPEPIDCSDPAQSARCITTCEDDGDSECPEIDIQPLVDPSAAERDEVSAVYYERNVGEQMWINYYSDRGGVRSPVRLLNDALTGWNDDYGVEFYAPKEPGPLSIWAVTHDNRGAADFVRVRLQAVAP